MCRNIFIFLILIFYLVITHSEVQTRWIPQRINNFEINSQFWLNRYFINEEFATLNGPIFIFVNSGEDVVDLQWLTHGLMYDVANINKALMLSLEPRFYGQSRPTFDTSVESLQLLLHNQTLYDLANFIQHFKNEANFTESKVVLWGNGFGATYAVWLKQTFPTLIDGVWASNARLEAVSPGYPNYYNNFAETLNSIGGPDCFVQFQKTTLNIDELISNHNTQEIEREFLLCFPIETRNLLDVAIFRGYLLETIDKALRQSNNAFIKQFCDKITVRENQSNISALGAWLRSEIRGDNCLMVSYQFIFPSLRSTSWNSITAYPNGVRQWYWQLCSEFATFRTTEISSDLFPGHLPFSLFHDVCRMLFGNRFDLSFIDEGARIVNERYGGLNVIASNVYFTNSELNSFRNLAPSQNLSNESPLSDLYPEGQLSDLRSINITDTRQLLLVKLRVYELVAEWIQR